MPSHTSLFGAQSLAGPSRLRSITCSPVSASSCRRTQLARSAAQRRPLSTSSRRSARTHGGGGGGGGGGKGHYEALSLPHNASKAQIKAKFYELSKKHHPDAGGDENKFHEISEAYATLGNDMKRKQYDTQLSSPSGSSAHYASPQYTTQRRTSSGPHRAWSPPPPPYSSASGTYQPYGKRTPPNFGGGASGFSPYASAFNNAFNTNKSSSSSSSASGPGQRRRGSVWDQAGKESGAGEGTFLRFLLVGGVVLLVLVFGGGVTARAEDGGGRSTKEKEKEGEWAQVPRRAVREGWGVVGDVSPVWRWRRGERVRREKRDEMRLDADRGEAEDGDDGEDGATDPFLWVVERSQAFERPLRPLREVPVASATTSGRWGDPLWDARRSLLQRQEALRRSDEAVSELGLVPVPDGDRHLGRGENAIATR